MPDPVPGLPSLPSFLLPFSQFNIPADVLFDYERLVRILLHIVSEHTSEENNFIQRAGIFLLNSLACQVSGL